MLKRILVTVALLGVTAASYGQGTVVFDNQGISTGAAPVIDVAPSTNRIAGAAFSGQLYSAPGTAAESSLTAAETRVQFRSGLGAGFVVFNTAVMNAFTGQPVDPEVTVTPTANGVATI